VALLIASPILLWIAAHFAPAPKADGTIAIADEAGVLSPAIEDAIRQVRFPVDTPAVVRTIAAIPREKIGTFATDVMSEEAAWSTLRRRNWLRRYFMADLPHGPGVYLLVSLDPELLQIRFGPDIRLAAYQQSIAVGSWYRARQRFERADLESHVLATVKDVAERMSKVAAPSWPLSWVQGLSSFVASEVDDFLAPSNGAFSDEVLSRYIKLAHVVGATGSAWRFMAFGVVAFLVTWVLVRNLLVMRLFVPRIRQTWVRRLLIWLVNLGLLGIVVTGLAALAALSKGRIEDEMALDVMGLSFLSRAGFDPATFTVHGGWWLAIPGAMVSFIREMLDGAKHQRETGETRITFGWVCWGCMLFLLPRSIAILAFVTLIWETVSTMKEAVAAEEAPARAGAAQEDALEERASE
jgi:hypothetical protein